MQDSSSTTEADRTAAYKMSAEQERRLWEEVDRIIVNAADLLSVNGVWARFVLSLLEEILEGREVAERVLSGSEAALAEFAENIPDLIALIREQLDRVDNAFYVLITEADFALFVEPGCKTSPITLKVDQHTRLRVAPNASVFTMVGVGSEDPSMLDLLTTYAAEKNKLIGLLWHVPLRPSYMLERLDDFQAELAKYREQLETFRVWQNDMVTADDEVRAALVLHEEDYRKVLGHAVRAAGLFPADMLTLPTKISEARRRIDEIQGEVMIASEWVVGMAISNFRKPALNKGADVFELKSEGFQFLARLMKNFDWRRGVRFSTFALRGVKSHIRDTLASMNGAMRIPAGSGRHAERVAAIVTRLMSENGHMPTAAEVAEVSGLSVNVCRDLMQVAGRVVSLDGPVSDSSEKNVSYMDAYADESIEAPDDAVERTDEMAQLKQIWERMPDVERLVIGWDFGAFGLPKLSHASIAQQLQRPVTEVPDVVRKARKAFRKAIQKSPAGSDMFATLFASSMAAEE